MQFKNFHWLSYQVTLINYAMSYKYGKCTRVKFALSLFWGGWRGEGVRGLLQNNYSTRPFWIRDDYSKDPVKRLVGFVSSHIQHALVI